MEHLSNVRQEHHLIDTPPTGIIRTRHNAQQNGIAITEDVPQFNPDGTPLMDPATGNQVTIERPRTDQEIANDGAYMGRLLVDASFQTPVSLDAGSPAYVEQRNEHSEEELAQIRKDAMNHERLNQLNAIRHTSSDPLQREAAGMAIDHLDDPSMAPAYKAKATQLLKSREDLSRNPRSRHLRQEVTRLERELSDMSYMSRAPRPERQWWQPVVRVKSGIQKAQKGARKSMESTGTSRTHIADTLGTGGTRTNANRQINNWLENRRFNRESRLPENLVSAKGSIIQTTEEVFGRNPELHLLADRRYVVMDTVSQYAQAFRPTDPAGTVPIPMAPHPINTQAAPGQDGFLHTIYINVAAPGHPILLKPVPRDHTRVGGTAHQHLHNGDIGYGESTDGRFYYEDGVPINMEAQTTVDLPMGAIPPANAGKVSYADIPDPLNPGATVRVQRVEVPVISEDSFSPGEDLVILRPLLTGAEAFDRVVRGAELDDLLLHDVVIRLSDLTSFLYNQEIGVISSQNDREEILQSHLIYHDEDAHSPTDGLRSTLDETVDTGHFRRYQHLDQDARTSREIRQQDYLQFISAVRHRALTAGRQSKLLQNLRKP
jgi:hypothetical protein